VKHLSKSLITILLVSMVVFSFFSCQTTPKVEVIEPTVPVVVPAAPPAVVAVVEEPAPLIPVVPVFVPSEVEGKEAPTDIIVKAKDRVTDFDIYIAHTNDILGSLDEGIGFAKLATGLEFGSSLSDYTLVLDAGNAFSGSAVVERLMGEPIAMLFDALGYDAVAPGPADFAYGAGYLIQAASLAEELTNIKVLSSNVLSPKGEWVFQPYQLYDFNGFVVAVAGVTAPPKNTEGLSFLSDEIIENAQWAVDAVRQEADFVVLLGSIGNVDGITSTFIAENIDGIDLIIDGKDAMVSGSGRQVGNTTIVGGTSHLNSVGVVEVSVSRGKATSVTPIRINAMDVNNPERSALASWAGIDFVPAHPEVQAYIDSVKADYVRATTPPPAPVVKAEPVKEEVVVAVEPVVAPAPIVVDKDVIVKSSGSDKDFDLYVVHTNDVHGRIEGDEGIGYPKLATLVKEGRAITDKILLLDAGDVSHGTLLTNLFEGETSFMLLTMLGYDAMVPGNHEFNYGQERLVEAARFAEENTNLRVLSANILDRDGNMVFQPYQLYSFDGFVVGVIGATTPDTEIKTHPKNVVGLSFASDEVLYGAQALVDEVRSKSDYVILLAHLGLDEDGSYGMNSEFVANNIHGIDLIVDGHSHTTLPNGYRVGDTLIVSTGEYMKNVGVVEISVRNKKVVDEYAFLISEEEVKDPSTSELAQWAGITTVPEDPQVLSYIASQKALLTSVTQEVVAYTPINLDGERETNRTRPTNLGTMVAQAMLEATGADVAITNGGGVRASIKAGNVTRGDIISVLPFNNTVVMIEVTGQDLYDAMEWGYSVLPETNGGFPQTANLQIVYSRFSDPGNRIKRLFVDGKAVDRNATYRLATNDFMAAGGDGYTMLDKPIVMYGRGLDEALTEYMVKHNQR